MYAVIETGGKQYRVEVGTELEVELLGAEAGQTITLDRVLLVADGETAAVGQPLVANASVAADVVRQIRGPKLISFKYRPKARRRVTKGHRQELTVLRISDIVHDGRSAAAAVREAEEVARAERQRAAEAARRQAEADAKLAAELAAKAPAKPARASTARRTAKPASRPRATKTEVTGPEVAGPEVADAPAGTEEAGPEVADASSGAEEPTSTSAAGGAPAAGGDAEAEPEKGSAAEAPEDPKKPRSTRKDG